MRKLAAGLLIICISTVAHAGIVSLVYDGNMFPDPNTEITIEVHTDTPLCIMEVYASITGDANITSAMSPADCNQYGWEPGWEIAPYIDPNGWVYFGGIVWPGETSGTAVGYFKFIYHSGQVTVAFTTVTSDMDEYSSTALSADCEYIPFSTDILTFGVEDQNSQYYGGEDFGSFFFEQEQEGSQQLVSGDGGFYFCPELTFDNIINFCDFAKFATNWQQSGTGLAGDFDDSGTVDFNDLVNIAYYWLQPVNWPVEVNSVVAASATLTSPVDIAINSYGDVYVLTSSGQLSIYDVNLNLQGGPYSLTFLSNPKGIAVDDEYNIYIADTGHHRLTIYFSALEGWYPVGSYGSGWNQFNQPTAISVDSSGSFYVSDSGNNRIAMYQKTEEYTYDISAWGQFGVSDGNLSNPSGLCMLGNNEIFIADTNNNRIQRLGAASGYFYSKVGSFGSGYTQFNALHGICYDIAFDQIIAADSNNNRLQIFQLHSHGGNGSSEMVFAKAISDQNFLNPMAVACKYDPNDPNQIIFVADTGNNRVLKLRVQDDEPNKSPPAIFNSFKTALDANDIDGALAFFIGTSRDTYEDIFNAIGTNMSDYVGGMGELTLESAGPNTAKYEMAHQVGGQTLYFPVFFVRDELGNWKISKF